MADNKVRVVFEAFMDKFRSDVKAAAKATLEIGDAGAEASNKVNFDKSSESVNNLEAGLNRVKGALKAVAIGYVGKKIFNAAKENFGGAMEFQEEMAETFTLLPELSGKAREAMTEDVKKFAKDMKVLPENVTPALYQAISASIPEDEVFGFLEEAQKAARGGKAELETSVDVLSSIINAYGSDVISVTEASDLMFTAVKKGKTNFNDMASNMYSVLPIARALDLPFKNVTASISTMTAMGTQTAQSTTQIGRFLAEISRQGTKSSEIFESVAGKTFKSFIAEGYNIQDVLNVMEAAAKKLNVEVKDLFSSDEAGRAASTLSAGAGKLTEDLQAMEDSAGNTQEAYEIMNGTMAAVVDGIKAKISVFKIDVADKYFPEIEEAINKVDASFDRLDENGTLDRLATSTGNVVGNIILEFDKWLNNIDNIIDKINDLASFIENRLPAAIDLIKLMGKAFLAIKIINFINDIKNAAKALDLLTKAQWLLNAAMDANPIMWVIMLVMLLVSWIYKLTDGFENFEDLGTKALLSVNLRFLKFVEKLVWGVDVILNTLSFLLGDIPLIGTAFKSMADVSGMALKGLNSAIEESLNKINELNNKDINPSFPKGLPDLSMPGVVPGPSTPWIPGTDPKEHSPDVSPAIINTNLDKLNDLGHKKAETKTKLKPKPKKKTINDRIRDVLDRYDPDVDLYESRADLAKVKDDDKGVKQNKSLIAKTLRKQAENMLNLQLSSKGQDVKIVEAARNKLLIKIEETLKDINDGVGKMVGDFNTPSDLRVLTEYQYKVEKSDNNLSKRLVYSPDVSMYLTIADTGKKGVKQVKDEINHFTGAIFDNKNDLVTKFMQDVTRN